MSRSHHEASAGAVAGEAGVIERLTTLEVWAQKRYGDSAPSIYTLRRWVKQAKIYPLPEKHGRTYFVKETAEYVVDYNS